ncbi:MAG: helix-turn-helix domain-containing protein, partial [Lactobacillaceae bacterium]
MNFGNLLKSIRKQRGLTQYGFASLLFISPNTLSKLENNRATPSLELISIISKLSNLTITEILLTVKFGDTKNENEQKNKIVQSLLMYLATNSCEIVDLNVVVANSGVDFNEGKLLFPSL